ncbi:MAG TPA: glycosyltransferase family 4 protein [Polyangiales bacterium]
MKTVLFLTYRMMLGFGVDVVVHQVSKRLRQRGYRVVVGCIEADAKGFGDLPIERIKPSADAVGALAQRCGAHVLVAHTSPFFELLPELGTQFPCWAWEHGDPTPSLFTKDAAERQRIKDRKRDVYPRLAGVIAISDFIRQDIGFPPARVIYNGCDHVPERASKNQQDIPVGELRPLRIGTLMRLGTGEAFYKGNALFRQLAARLRETASDIDVCVMGRGNDADARPFRDAGIQVRLNASDTDKWRYLRHLDVFLSFSLWEGFNLPLAEAQALGTVGLAFDTGAHPEVTPLVLANVDEAVAQVRAYAANRELLLQHSQLCWHFVHRRFSWDRCAALFEETVLGSV